MNQLDLDRSVLLRAIAQINVRGHATAKRIAERLDISSVDAVAICLEEVTAGNLTALSGKKKHPFTYYVLTEKGVAETQKRGAAA